MSDQVQGIEVARKRRARSGNASTIEMLTVDQICVALGIDRSTFYQWRIKGKSPVCIKLPNGSIRVRRDEYERWLKSREEKAA